MKSMISTYLVEGLHSVPVDDSECKEHVEDIMAASAIRNFIGALMIFHLSILISFQRSTKYLFALIIIFKKLVCTGKVILGSCLC